MRYTVIINGTANDGGAAVVQDINSIPQSRVISHNGGKGNSQRGWEIKAFGPAALLDHVMALDIGRHSRIGVHEVSYYAQFEEDAD